MIFYKIVNILGLEAGLKTFPSAILSIHIASSYLWELGVLSKILVTFLAY